MQNRLIYSFPKYQPHAFQSLIEPSGRKKPYEDSVIFNNIPSIADETQSFEKTMRERSYTPDKSAPRINRIRESIERGSRDSNTYPEKKTQEKKGFRVPQTRIGGDIETDEDLKLFLDGMQEEGTHTSNARKRSNFSSNDPFLDGFDDPDGEKKKKREKVLDGISTALTAASLIPGLDTFTNLAQIPVDLLRGDFVSAGLDLLGILPFTGEVADAAKTARATDRIINSAKIAKNLDAASTVAEGMSRADDIIDIAITAEKAGDVYQSGKVASSAAISPARAKSITKNLSDI